MFVKLVARRGELADRVEFGEEAEQRRRRPFWRTREVRAGERFRGDSVDHVRILPRRVRCVKAAMRLRRATERRSAPAPTPACHAPPILGGTERSLPMKRFSLSIAFLLAALVATSAAAAPKQVSIVIHHQTRGCHT